jgi:hypothetical protein
LATKKKATIAYAISVTGLKKGRILFDGAAVVHQSIRLASRQSHYDYHMIAFVHPDAHECRPFLEKLGYEVQVRDTPFNETDMQNKELLQAQSNGCCGSKEYLKLYSYLMFDYPVVVHLDLDTLVLKPMDDLFDLMLDPSFNRSRIPAMWLKPEDFPPQIDFMFTRDYNMVDPPRRKPHQIGVQGGFMVIRPNATDFDRYVETILLGGDFQGGAGWGGNLAYGGYYGAGTIQGLASYYYGHLQQNRSLELNRCYYNSMVDTPTNIDRVRENNKTKLMCKTLEPDLKCQDCRKTDLEDIYTTHFTVCGKPDWCQWSFHKGEHRRLCMELFREWHKVRRSLEDEWKSEYPEYDPVYETVKVTNNYTHYLNFSQGHCRAKAGFQRGYIRMKFPVFENSPAEGML